MMRILPVWLALLAEIFLLPGAATAAELLMSNATPDPQTLWVDGGKACTARPGQQCSARVARGTHDVRAVTSHGRATEAILRIEDARFIWTVRYPEAEGGIVIQAAAYADRALAERAARKLSALGNTDVVSRRIGGRLLHKVELRVPSAGHDADALLAKVRAEGFREARIVARD